LKLFARTMIVVTILLVCLSSALAQDAVDIAIEQLGKPYSESSLGLGPNYFDCSGLVIYSYANAAQPIQLMTPGFGRTAAELSTYGEVVTPPYQRGDLLFFNTGQQRIIGHVGIFVEGNTMIAADRPYGQAGEVEYDSITDPYWVGDFLFAKRITSVPPPIIPETGNIIISAMSNGSPWNGPATFYLAGPWNVLIANNVVLPTVEPVAPGSYSLSLDEGRTVLPPNATLASITPSASQSLSAGDAINFSFDFSTDICPAASRHVNAGRTSTCPPPALSVACSCLPNPTTIDQQVTCTAQPSGGTWPIQYSWTAPGKTNATGQPLNLLYTTSGSYDVSVSASDSTVPTPQTATASCSPLQINPAPGAPILSSITEDRTPVVAQPFNLTINGTGFASGVAVYLCSAQGSCWQNPIVTLISSNQLSLPNVQWNGTGAVSIQAVNFGNLQSNVLSLSVDSLMSASCSINPTQINLGQTATVTAQGSGGTPPYQYQMPTGAPLSGTNTVTVQPTAIGPFSYSVTVEDSQGQVATGTCSTQVVGSPTTLTSLMPDRPPVVAQPFNLTINGTGFTTGVT